MVNYPDIFLQKTGQMEATSPWDVTRINGFLDNSTYLISKDFSTPWVTFDTLEEKYKYAVVIYAAIEYWWAKAGEGAGKFDMQVGGGTNQKSTQLFYRALEMIDYLKKELEELIKKLMLEDKVTSGDIILGNLVTRSKFTGRLIPYSTDPAGDWTS
jgi:hypothetical protein